MQMRLLRRSETPLSCVLTLWLGLSICFGATGCVGRGLRDLVRLLETQESDLESLADDWYRSGNDTLKIFAETGMIRWNEFHISPQNGKFLITAGAALREEVGSLEDAAQIAGTTAAELQRWRSRAESLRLSLLSAQDGTVALGAGEYGNYGLLYVTRANATTVTRYLEYSKQGVQVGGFRLLRHIRTQWFYYEA